MKILLLSSNVCDAHNDLTATKDDKVSTGYLYVVQQKPCLLLLLLNHYVYHIHYLKAEIS